MDSAGPRVHETSSTGGHLIARRLRAHGVSALFTLSGGHLFSIYDGCRREGIRLIDVRHEQTAAFAAEGWAKVTRSPGVAALTAGPGVTNGMSALASAQLNGSPIVILAGRAPAFRWGQGSLQEIDHVPFVVPLTKFAATAPEPGQIPALVEAAFAAAQAAPSGPAFIDFPLDVVFSEGAGVEPPTPLAPPRNPVDGTELERAAELLAHAERPVLMAGTGLYWARGENALRRFVEAHDTPVFLNGLGRGCLPADHPLFFSRTRSRALRDADVALVAGVPLDFRLGFGDAFGRDCRLIALDVAPPVHDATRTIEVSLYGDVTGALDWLAERPEAPPGRRGARAWVEDLRRQETDRRAAETEQLRDERAPLHPMRIYGELAHLLEREAIIVCDGGDFVSYAGRLIETYEPGCWLDPGPFGCLGSGPGYALAAKLARPDRQVVLLQGDGAFGFSGMEWDSLSRHGVAVVGVVGNNGIWGLEKHPMEYLYGYSVAADLRPGTRYDEIVRTLGGDGEFVERPGALRGALERALGSGRPALVNVLTDPGVAYPRSATLA